MSAAPAIKNAVAFRVEVVEGPHRGQSFSFDKSLITVGRGSENDVVLENDPRTSRQHLEVKIFNGQIIVTNLSEKNHVVIDGQTVQSQVLKPGQRVLLGETLLAFQLDQPANADPRSIVSMAPKTAAQKPMGLPTSPPLMPKPSVMPTPAPQGPVMPPPFGVPPGTAAPRGRRPSGQSNGRFKFYLIVGVVALGLYLFLSSGSKKKKQEPVIGPPPTIQQEILKADETKRQLQEQKTRSESLQARRAQENFTKGFRDFNQGQYARAREAFQVVLTLDPGHEEARRYLVLSRLKFDEQVKKHLQEGRVYFENKNYRLCKSSFLMVMTMLSQSPNDPTYQEAKKLYDICDLSQGGG